MPEPLNIVKPIPILSFWEPWGSLILAGVKHHETRAWATNLRGRIALHAAQVCDLQDSPIELCNAALGDGWSKTRPSGCVIGVADLTGCFRTVDLMVAGEHLAASDLLAGNFGPRRFGFRLENVRALREPLPLRGHQKFWRWMPPADLEARLLPPVDQVAAARAWSERS